MFKGNCTVSGGILPVNGELITVFHKLFLEENRDVLHHENINTDTSSKKYFRGFLVKLKRCLNFKSIDPL